MVIPAHGAVDKNIINGSNEFQQISTSRAIAARAIENQRSIGFFDRLFCFFFGGAKKKRKSNMVV